MPIKVKDSGHSASKWTSRAQGAVEDYTLGVQGTSDWEQKTKASEGSWKQGLTQAMARGAYGSGVSRAGNSKWQRKSLGPGAERYPSGIAAAEEDYRQGVEPYFAAMRSFSLGPKGPRGSSQNFERSRQLGQMLHRKRTGGGPIGTVG